MPREGPPGPPSVASLTPRVRRPFSAPRTSHPCCAWRASMVRNVLVNPLRPGGPEAGYGCPFYCRFEALNSCPPGLSGFNALLNWTRTIGEDGRLLEIGPAALLPGDARTSRIGQPREPCNRCFRDGAVLEDRRRGQCRRGKDAAERRWRGPAHTAIRRPPGPGKNAGTSDAAAQAAWPGGGWACGGGAAAAGCCAAPPRQGGMRP